MKANLKENRERFFIKQLKNILNDINMDKFNDMSEFVNQTDRFKICKLIYTLVNIESLRDVRVFTQNKESAFFIFKLHSSIIELLGILTPKEIENLFPIEKFFNGEKYEVKDYFTTKKLINSLPLNRPINENISPLGFLCEYQNKTLNSILINNVTIVNALNIFIGKPTIFEQFISTQNHREEKELIYNNKSNLKIFFNKDKNELEVH